MPSASFAGQSSFGTNAANSLEDDLPNVRGAFPFVMFAPRFHLLDGVLHGQDPVLVQARLRGVSVESLSKGIVREPPGPAEVHLLPVIDS